MLRAWYIIRARSTTWPEYFSRFRWTQSPNSPATSATATLVAFPVALSPSLDSRSTVLPVAFAVSCTAFAVSSPTSSNDFIPYVTVIFSLPLFIWFG